MEMGETEGALASLSIGLAGVISVFMIPWVYRCIIIIEIGAKIIKIHIRRNQI